MKLYISNNRYIKWRFRNIGDLSKFCEKFDCIILVRKDGEFQMRSKDEAI